MYLELSLETGPGASCLPSKSSEEGSVSHSRLLHLPLCPLVFFLLTLKLLPVVLERKQDIKDSY